MSESGYEGKITTAGTQIIPAKYPNKGPGGSSKKVTGKDLRSGNK